MIIKTALLGCLLVFGAACASTNGGGSHAEALNPEAEMEAMLLLGAPGEAHAELAEQVGSWTTSMKSYMEPGQPPMVTPGQADISAILGGRVILEHYSCDFMGMPFEGRLIQGYDNLSNEYWTIWVDNMTTGYSLSRGTKRTDGALVLNGVMKDMRTPDGRPTRSVIVRHGPDAANFKMYDTGPDGAEFLMMEIDYTR